MVANATLPETALPANLAAPSAAPFAVNFFLADVVAALATTGPALGRTASSLPGTFGLDETTVEGTLTALAALFFSTTDLISLSSNLNVILPFFIVPTPTGLAPAGTLLAGTGPCFLTAVAADLAALAIGAAALAATFAPFS